MNDSVNNKIIAITGGSSGIGKAIASQALENGARVAVCGRNIETLRDAFKNYKHNNLFLIRADVSREEDCRQFVEEIIQKWGRMDILINNAGISMRAMFSDVDLNVLRELMDINFWGTVYCTKFALPYICKSKGSIVGISSIAGYRGLPARTGYSSSKFAMQGFLESLRTEMKSEGVNVMWVAPGFTSSNIRNTALAADGNIQKETPLKEDKLMSAEQCAALILKAIEKRERTIVMTLQGKATVFLNKLFPGFMDKMVFNHFAKEPGSPLKSKK